MCTIARKFNNPLNIRLTNDRWIGQIIPDKGDKFVKFSHSIYGFRAFFRLLLTYRYRHNIWTIKDIITRYAPATENNTDLYIATVCNYMDLSPDATIAFDDKDLLCSLAWCMCKVESGEWWNTDHICIAYDMVFADMPLNVEISEL